MFDHPSRLLQGDLRVPPKLCILGAALGHLHHQPELPRWLDQAVQPLEIPPGLVQLPSQRKDRSAVDRDVERRVPEPESAGPEPIPGDELERPIRALDRFGERPTVLPQDVHESYERVEPCLEMAGLIGQANGLPRELEVAFQVVEEGVADRSVERMQVRERRPISAALGPSLALLEDRGGLFRRNAELPHLIGEAQDLGSSEFSGVGGSYFRALSRLSSKRSVESSIPRSIHWSTSFRSRA